MELRSCIEIMVLMKTRLNSLVARAIRKKWPPDLIQKYVGTFQQCFFTYATDPSLREKAASGGSVTALLSTLLSNGQISGALVCRSIVTLEGKLRPQLFIARNEHELLSAQGSKYIAVNFASQAFPLIRSHEGKLAVVALPCDISILQRACMTNSAISQKIALTIGLFCGHNTESALTDRIIDKLQPGDLPLVSFSYRIGHWRGHLQAEFGQGKIATKQFSYFSDYQNLYFFSQRKCHYCYDHTGYYADLSAGDIWSLRMKNEPIKHTALIARTCFATQVVNEALENQVLTGNVESIEEVCEGQARTLPFHYNISARAKVGGMFGEKIKDAVGEKVHLLDIVIAWMIMFNERISRTKIGRIFILAVPHLFLKFYSYLIKLFETISKPSPGLSTRQIIGIIGGTVWGNRGAESMLVTTIGRLHELYPDAAFKIFSYSPTRDRQLVHREDLDILSCKPASLVFRIFPYAVLCWIFKKIGIRIPDNILPLPARELRNCGILLDIGGISFVDGRELYLPFNILTIWPAMLLGIPVVKLAQALGPFHHPINRMVAKIFLPRCKHIFARGEITFRNLRDLKLDNFTQVSDLAFLYKPVFNLSDENENLVHAFEEKLTILKNEKKRIIVLSPSSVIYEKTGERYLKQLLDLVRQLDKEDVHFLFLPNSTRAGIEKPRNNDIYIVNLLRQLARSELSEPTWSKMHWVDWDLNTRSLRRLISLADLLLTSRFHAMVSGLSLGVPTLVIGWSHKYIETLTDFKLERYAADFDDRLVNLADLAKELLQNANLIRQQLAGSLPDVQISSEQQFFYLESIIK
jgi:coenzyme F420-reducing hydrogenase beta subunit/polysaccharide pyruvyl transferase WcaK-like protein